MLFRSSLLSGWYTQIALLKLLNFWFCITAILAGLVVIRSGKNDMSEWFVSLIVATTVFGIAALVLGQGYNFISTRLAGAPVTTDLFDGAFLHPNCHSLYASLFVLFMASLYLLAPYRNRWLALPTIASWFGFMALSKSRTSALAAAIPLVILVLYARPRVNKRGFRMRLNVSRVAISAAAVCLVLLAVAYDAVSSGVLAKSVVAFFNKGQSSESVALDTEQILKSRKGLIEFSWNNFRENPIHGIGFQVAKNDFFIRNATLFSAPAEKGFLPTAILEEGGILGASSFLILLAALFADCMRDRNVPAIVAFLGFLISNFGEVSIFSPGGSGAFGWIMVGAASILGDHCWRAPLQPRSPHL